MTKKDLVVIGGVATIVVVLTDYATKRVWKDVHTVAGVAGAVVTILGATS